MGRSLSISDLLGEDLAGFPLGEDLTGPTLQAGWITDRNVAVLPEMQLGDGLAGPANDQPFQIQRDNRVIPADSLGMLVGGVPAHLGKLARHRAGRTFPLNFEWGAGLDPTNPGLAPTQDGYPGSPAYWGQDPGAHDGFQPPEILPSPSTVFYTASPNVGWRGY